MKLSLLLLIALLALSASEHVPANNGLPLVKAATPVQAPMLFAPCPVSPQNFPRTQERRT